MTDWSFFDRQESCLDGNWTYKSGFDDFNQNISFPVVNFT